MQKASTLLETGNYALPFVSIYRKDNPLINWRHITLKIGLGANDIVILGQQLKMSRSFPFSVSNILWRFCGQIFRERRQMPFQNKRPNNIERILVFALAKKTANSRWNFTWRRLCFIFDLILHIHTLLIIAFYIVRWKFGRRDSLITGRKSASTRHQNVSPIDDRKQPRKCPSD